MKIKVALPMVVLVLLLALSQGCLPVLTTTPIDYSTATPTVTATATTTATGMATATPTATGSDNAPRAVPAGVVVMNWSAGNHTPQLAFDAPGRLNLFFQTNTTAGGLTYSQAQMNADGAWTSPVAISPEFQQLANLTAVPDMSGRLCVLWSGQMYDPKGNSVYGLFRNCQQADGTWLAQAQQPAVTSTWAAFSAARASNGALQSVMITTIGSVYGLFYSPIVNAATTPLTGTQLSGSQQVLLARLAIDSNGGYHAAWAETPGDTTFTVQHRYSKDGGKTWTPAEQLYSGSADNPAGIGFSLAADSVGQVHLAWDGDQAVHYRRWSAAGGWGDPIELSVKTRNQGVQLAVGKDGLARAAWRTSAANPSVIMRLQAGDGTWGPPRTVTPTRAYELALALDQQGASQVVWSADDGLRYLSLP